MSNILQTPLARLEREQRLLNPQLKGPSRTPQRFGYRGDLLLEFRDAAAGAPSEPELLCRQVFKVGNEGAPAIDHSLLAAVAQLSRRLSDAQHLG